MPYATTLDEVLALRSENAKLRAALIQTGNNIGAALSDQVTADFLMLVPEEARLKIERLNAVIRAREGEIAFLKSEE